MSREPEDSWEATDDLLAELEDDDTWLDDEEPDADDDQPEFEDPHEGVEWDEDDDECC